MHDLFFAILINNLSQVKKYIESGVSVNTVKDPNSKYNMGHLAIVAYLLQQGADPNVQDSRGYTPLHLAIMQAKTANTREERNRFITIGKCLLIHHADLNIKSNFGTTCREKAHENKMIARLLLEPL